jgi:hypothetical protein
MIIISQTAFVVNSLKNFTAYGGDFFGLFGAFEEK